MANYTVTTNFAAKDSLPSGNPSKVIKGTEFSTEYNNIATAIATKSDVANPVFTGTATIVNLTLTGTFTGTLSGGTY